MNTLTTFSSDKDSLNAILENIKSGKIQLPDFQRGWVWDDEHIRDLLVSVSLSYPIGTVMLIETGNADVKFKPRLVEGVDLSNLPKAERRNFWTKEQIQESMDDAREDNITKLVKATQAYLSEGKVYENRYEYFGSIGDEIEQFILENPEPRKSYRQ